MLFYRMISHQHELNTYIYSLYLRIDLNFFFVHEEINSKMWYTLCNPQSGLRKGVYHIFEFNSNERTKNCDHSL